MKKGFQRMLSKFVEELSEILEAYGDMPVAISDVNGNFYTSDMYFYPQTYYYDSGYIFPVSDKEQLVYDDYETSRLDNPKGSIDLNPLLEDYKMVLKIIGRSPEERSNTLNGKPYES